ncbi:adenylyltransferase/cytidyltransferase family protein [Candidatus Woesearchaeota archaeon]|nr:adenylyltransferase/cytidyltransferase family protein [Candidatus Woesearchaeota archaeon]
MINKIKTREDISKISNELKSKGKKIVTINGSFDIIHRGHLSILEEAKKQGDILVVGLNSDKSVREWKKHIGYKDWEKRPYNTEKDRAELLAGFKCVDYVTIFNEPDCLKFVESIKPDVHVNGSEYGKDCIEAPIVKKYGGKVYIVKIKGNLSTSNLIDKIRNS